MSKAFILVFFLLGHLGVSNICYAQPSVGTTNFDELIATTSTLASSSSSASSADLSGTGSELTIRSITTSTCQIIGASGQPDRDDLIQGSSGGLNTDYVSLKMMDKSFC
nr:hypothetical protein [uncultured Draconibacterium sp.]